MRIHVGEQLKDNDPRCAGRLLRITSLGLRTEMGLQGVRARGTTGPEVSIAVKRIHVDGKPRKSGFDLIPAVPASLAALVGHEVVLVRGSRGRTEGPGHERSVRARLDSLSAFDVFATLLEDDPNATTAPFKAGESGVWNGHSFVDVEASMKARGEQ